VAPGPREIRKALLHGGDASESSYERLAWWVYDTIVRQEWFEGFVLLNILLVGIATGVDLENANNPSQGVTDFVAATSMLTLTVFTLEVVLKVVSYGLSPLVYFTDEHDGAFNCFDFTIVFLSYCFLGRCV
jgi:hypothetical protein